jgi:hypothetical protein
LSQVWNGYNLRGQIGDGTVSSGWRVRINYIVSIIFNASFAYRTRRIFGTSCVCLSVSPHIFTDAVRMRLIIFRVGGVR